MTVDVQLSFSRARNIVGGATGSIPYQTANSSTFFISIGAPSTVLQSNGTTATWATLGSLTAGASSQVSTIQRTTNASHFLTFVDSDNPSATAESLYTTSTIFVNPTTGVLTARSIVLNTNSNGLNILVGDDAWIGDIDQANTLRVMGNQNNANAFIVFGNSNTQSLGRTGTGPLTYSGNFAVSAATNATSTTTGALVVTGGAGIGGNLYVGGEIVAQRLTIQLTTITTTLVQTDDIIQTANTTNATSTTTGALIVSGGAGIGQDLRVGGTIFGNISGTLTGNAGTVSTVIRTTSADHFLTFVDSNNASATAESIYTTSSVYLNPNNGQLWAAQLRQTGINVAIGAGTASSGQGNNAVAIGVNAGQTSQGLSGIAIGLQAGAGSQGQYAVAIGDTAGNTNQGLLAVAVGPYAGQNSQTQQAVSIGYFAGQNNQGLLAVSVGAYAGRNTQTSYAVAIGFQAGQDNQGTNAIAIGNSAGQTNQPANSIIINASGSALNGTNAGFYVNPIRADASTSATSNVVYYNPVTRELTTGTIGSFGGNASTVNTVIRTTNATHFLTFVDSNNASATAESLYTTSSVTVNPSTGEVDILSNLASTSTTTGALVVTGGIGAGGSIYSGNRIGFVNSANFSSAYMFYNTATTSIDFVFP